MRTGVYYYMFGWYIDLAGGGKIYLRVSRFVAGLGDMMILVRYLAWFMPKGKGEEIMPGI